MTTYFLLYIFYCSISEILVTCIFFIYFPGTILPIVVAVLEPVWKKHPFLTFSYLALTVGARISPLFAFSVGLARVALLARSNALCREHKHLCPNLSSAKLPFHPEICCRMYLFYRLFCRFTFS